MKYVYRFLLLVFAAALGVFLVQNQKYLGQSVELAFFGWRGTLVLGMWLLISFLAGVLVYFLVDLPSSIAKRLEMRRKLQELVELQSQMFKHNPPPE